MSLFPQPFSTNNKSEQIVVKPINRYPDKTADKRFELYTHWKQNGGLPQMSLFPQPFSTNNKNEQKVKPINRYPDKTADNRFEFYTH